MTNKNIKAKKIFIIPNHYDYHEQGEILVKASSKEEAIEIVKKKFADEEYDFKPDFENIKEWEDEVYENEGCDC